MSDTVLWKRSKLSEKRGKKMAITLSMKARNMIHKEAKNMKKLSYMRDIPLSEIVGKLREDVQKQMDWY